MTIFKRVLSCLMALASLTGTAAEPLPDGMVAINRAGELRMLSQRIVRIHAQIGMDVQPRVDRRLLADSVRRLDSNLRWLQAFPATDVARLGELQGHARALISAIDAAPDLSKVMALNVFADALLADAERLTNELQASVGREAGRRVNLAGRLRMLSQRRVKAYMLRAWGDPSPDLEQVMQAATNDFNSALSELQKYGGNSADISAELDELALQWEWLGAAIATEGTGTYRLIVAESCEAILAAADHLVTLYQRLESTK